MQRLLVIFALGLGLLLPACAVQDLPFSGTAAEQDNTTPAPYRPQQGAVHDGSSEEDRGYYSQQPIPADQVPMPTGMAPVPSHADTAPAAPPAPAPAAGQAAPEQQAAPAAAPKPITRTASGLQEREL